MAHVDVEGAQSQTAVQKSGMRSRAARVTGQARVGRAPVQASMPSSARAIASVAARSWRHAPYTRGRPEEADARLSSARARPRAWAELDQPRRATYLLMPSHRPS